MNIKYIHSKEEIYRVLQLLRNHCFNPDNKTNEALIKLSEKYSKNGCFLVADKGDKAVGLCAFYANDNIEKKAYISLIVIDNSFQNQGLGTLMINKVKEISISRGMKYLLLEVDNNNKKAINFYEKNDFVCFQEDLSSSIYRCVLK